MRLSFEFCIGKIKSDRRLLPLSLGIYFNTNARSYSIELNCSNKYLLRLKARRSYLRAFQYGQGKVYIEMGLQKHLIPFVKLNQTEEQAVPRVYSL